MKTQPIKKETKEVKPEGFTGVARSVKCSKHEDFTCYRIVTLTIQNGIVVDTRISQPYMSFELKDVLEHAQNKSIDNMIFKWEDGRTLESVDGM